MKRTLQRNAKAKKADKELLAIVGVKKRKIMTLRGVVAMKRHYFKKFYPDSRFIPCLKIRLYTRIAAYLEELTNMVYEANLAGKPYPVVTPKLTPDGPIYKSQKQEGQV